MNIDIDTLVGQLATWETQRYFKQISFLEAGWEWWFQTDFVAWLLQQSQGQLDVVREGAIFTDNNQKVDLLFNNHANDYPKIAIEIKCETPKSVGFMRRVKADENKLNEVDVKYYRCYVLVIAINQATAQDLLNENYVCVHQTDFIAFFLKHVI